MNERRWSVTSVLLLSLPVLASSAVAAEEQKGVAPSVQTALGQGAKATAAQSAAPAPSAPGQLAVPAAAQPTETAAEPDVTGPYTIKQGDTLWDISALFLKDPFLWPLIWKVNPPVVNPDLIYPGNLLVIPSLAPIERAISAPEAPVAVEARKEAKEVAAAEAPKAAVTAPVPQAPVVREAPSELPFQGKRRIDSGIEEPVKKKSHLLLPEEAAPVVVDKYAMLNAGFVDREEVSPNVVVGGMEQKTIFSFDDILLVKMRSPDEVNIGDKFLVYELGKNIKHPATGKDFGKMTKVLGVIQVIAKEPSGIVSGKVTISFDYIEKGDRVAPYIEPSLVHPPTEPRSKDISGYVLAVRDTRTLNGQLDYVYLDKGAVDGVEQGDRFTVYLVPEKRGYPNKVIGEVQVFLVKDQTATAFVRKSTDAVARGDRITFKQ